MLFLTFRHISSPPKSKNSSIELISPVYPSLPLCGGPPGPEVERHVRCLLYVVHRDLVVPLGVEGRVDHVAHQHVGAGRGHVVDHGRVQQEVLAREKEVHDVVLERNKLIR